MSPQVLAYIRRVTGETMTDTCTIEEASHTPDSMGGTSISWTEVATDAPCRIIQAGDQNRSQAMMAAEQETIRHLYKLIVAYDGELGVDMRVTCGGIVYDVVQVETALTDKAFRSAIIVRRE